MEKTDVLGWEFSDNSGTFELPDPDRTSGLYFPLANEAGIYSAITPQLKGDIKADHNTYLLLPQSIEDLHNAHAGRAFWISAGEGQAWNASGDGAAQAAARYTNAADPVRLEAGFLWQRVTRRSPRLALQAQVTSFVPWSQDKVELMQVTLTNTGPALLRLTPTAAVPIFGRSAENLRDHRHVTSLLQRAVCHPHGVLVKPTLSFDERGHQPNPITYAVLGTGPGGTAPLGFFPSLDEFVGEGGSLDWPQAVICQQAPPCSAGDHLDGYEALGGLRFADLTLQPGESASYVLILAILPAGAASPQDLLERYGSPERFEAWLEQTRQHWQAHLDGLRFHTGEPRFNAWMCWVTLQPTLRRLFGNSFLPYHDYGRGGRGWRDLWQDALALLLVEPSSVGPLLLSSFGGVRMDGSNATMIGSQPGQFWADRNNIPRVWMDHGAWPLLTTRLYIDQTGDLAFLLRPQSYFKDHLVWRSTRVDAAWSPDQGTLLHTAAGGLYQGSILEHLLIQQLTQFFNVGAHNIIRLEGADWNDALDMARQGGESVAFSAFYASNLRQLGELALALHKTGLEQVELASELLALLDTLGVKVDYSSPQAKQARLGEYFQSVSAAMSGQKTAVSLEALAKDLFTKADCLSSHIRSTEWVTSAEGFGWFNGYYDNDSQRVEGDFAGGVRMTLTGQVFALAGGIASDEQAAEILRSARRYLYEPAAGGYRLNTDFGAVLLNLGRCFGFAFGHKENGAMFSHMAVMFAHSLYQRGFTRQGWQVLDEMYRHSQNFSASRIYPGLPEYFSPSGRGMYPYLTGSASWYLLTLVTQAFGVRGRMGDLLLAPKLVKEQFDDGGQASLITSFAGRRLQVTYSNPAGLDCGEYRIRSMRLGQQPPQNFDGPEALLPRALLAALPEGELTPISVELNENLCGFAGRLSRLANPLAHFLCEEK